MDPEHRRANLERVVSILEMADSGSPVIRPTALYNEGWLLQLVLQAEAEGIHCMPFRIPEGTRYYGEPLLSSPFLYGESPESHTHADAAIGQFDFRASTKAGLRLLAHSTSFEVVEAKLFSGLSKGVKNASWYDQAARTVACIGWAVALAGLASAETLSLGFTVLAPKSYTFDFSELVERKSVRTKVARRLAQFPSRGPELASWFQDCFEPLLPRIALRVEAWEDVLARVDLQAPARSAELRSFYEACLLFGGGKK